MTRQAHFEDAPGASLTRRVHIWKIWTRQVKVRKSLARQNSFGAYMPLDTTKCKFHLARHFNQTLFQLARHFNQTLFQLARHFSQTLFQLARHFKQTLFHLARMNPPKRTQ